MQTIRSQRSRIAPDWLLAGAQNLTKALYRILATVAPDCLSERYKSQLAASRQLTCVEVAGREHSRSLEAVYVPVQLASCQSHEVAQRPEHVTASWSTQHGSIRRDVGPGTAIQDVLLRSSRVLLLGEAGSGKTTLLRRLALMVARDELPPDYVRRLTFTHQDVTMDTLLPILVSLPRFASSDREILPYLTDLFADSGVPQARPYLHRKLDAGQCLLLLDGLDQVADDTQRQGVVRQIRALTERYNKPNQIVVSSRPVDPAFELDGFECVELLPLGDDDVERFVKQWFAEEPVRAEALLAALEASPAVRSMANSPRLLSVLAAACTTEGGLSVRSVDLFDSSVDALLGETIRPDLKACAQRLAYELQIRRQHTFSLEQMSRVVRKAESDRGGPGHQGEELLVELATETDLLIRASGASYRFCHPALREYLAAREVRRRDESVNAAGRVDDPWWRHLIVLIAGLERDATDLVRDLPAGREEHAETVLLAAHCLREADHSDGRLRTRVRARLFALFDEAEPSFWSPAAAAIAALEGKRARQAFPDFLRSDDPRLRARAARAMARLGEPWGSTPLIAALGDESPRVRKEAAQALGALGDERAIRPLVKLLDDDDGEVCRQALQALGAIGDPALEPLIEALGDPSPCVPPRAAKALSLLGEAAIPALLTALGSEREQLREGAVAALAEIGPPATDALVAALQSENAQLRLGAVAALGRGGSRRGLRAIVKALGDPRDMVRDEAARTLVRLGSPAVPPVVAALTDANLRVSEQAAYVLGEMGQPAVDGLLRALEGEKRALRWAAVKVLGSVGAHGPNVVSKLRDILSDERAEVRQSAVRALARIGGATAVEVLIEALSTDDEVVRAGAKDALVRVGSDEVVNQLHKAFERDVEPDRLITVAGRIGSPAARDFLRELLESDDRAIQDAAALALETDQTSGLYLYRAWEPRIEEYLLERGTVTTAMLTGTPNGLRPVVLQRHVSCHPEMDLSYEAEMGLLRLNTFSKSRAVNEHWNRVCQNLGDEVDSSKEMFETHVARLVEELCSILGATTAEVEEKGRLYGFALDLLSVVQRTNLPRTIPLVFLRGETLSERDLDDLRRLLAKMKVQHRTALLVLFSLDKAFVQAKELLDDRLRDVHAFDVIALGKKDIQHIATARDPQKALRFTICEQADLTLVSPYFFNEPASRTLFFGREFEIRTITQTIPNSSVAVLGGRRIGKTSILRKVSDLLCESYRCQYMDCHAIRNYDVLFRTLEYRLPAVGGLSPEPVSFRSVVAELRDDQILIFALDEIDALLRYDIEKDELLFKTFRSLSQEGQCRFIFSGARLLNHQLKYGRTSPLFNFCGQRVQLGYLDPKSAERLIVEPMGWMNIDLREEAQVVERILALSSCHPRLVQYVCHSLIEQINREGVRFITPEHVQRIADSYEFREEYLQTVWGDATRFERALTLTLDKVTVTQEEIQAALQRWDIPYTWEKLRAALHHLEFCSILKREDDAFRFVAEDFPRIARESLDIEMEINSLKRRIRRERDL